MTILNKDVLTEHGPYITFCILDRPLDSEVDFWNARSDYEHGVFFEFALNLLGTYCGVLRCYSPFDDNGFIQFERPYDIYEFSAKLVMWEYQLAVMPDNYFGMELEYFSAPTPGYEDYTREQFKIDLLETLYFLIGKFHQAASEGKCVAIIGI